MKNLLKELNACEDAREWAADKTWQEVYETCHRGDWLLWLFKKTNPDDLQLLTLAKGHCANTVRHLMKDERSIKAIDAAIAFGLGEINKDELDASASASATASAYASTAYASAAYAAASAAYAADAASASASASATAYASAAYAAASAAYAAASASASASASAAAYAAAYASASASASASAADDAAYAADAARKQNEQQTADIVRKYISIEKFNI